MSQYCQPSDLTLFAIPATALTAQITTPMQVAACVAASSEADSAMRGRYPLPITGSVAGGPGVYDPALVRHTAYIAAYSLMSQRGFQGAGADNMIRENYYKAVGNPNFPGSHGFFGEVARQNRHLDVTGPTPSGTDYQFPAVHSRTPRGI